MLLTVVTLLTLAVPDVSDTLGLIPECPDKQRTCVRMTLDDGARDPLAAVPSADAEGMSVFLLPVRGRLGSGESRDYVLRLRSYTDGMACSSLGEASVAVVGYSASGAVQVLTTAGVLTLEESSLRVGCVECARLLEADGSWSGGFMRTPAWDPGGVGLDPEALSYDDEGRLYVKVLDNCVVMRQTGPFALVDPRLCTAMETLGHYERPALGITLKPAEWILRAPGQRRALFLKRGACT